MTYLFQLEEKEVFIQKRASPPCINKIGQVGASKDMATYVIEVTDLKSEVRHDLQGCLEAVVTSEAAKTFHIIKAICTRLSG